MTWIGPDSAASVVVPDVVGQEVSYARKLAWDAGVVLVAADPDGPPLGALTWPGQWTVTAQSRAPGSAMRYRGSLAIEYRPGGPVAGSRGDSPGEESGDREPRRPKPSPGSIGAELDLEVGGE